MLYHFCNLTKSHGRNWSCFGTNTLCFIGHKSKRCIKFYLSYKILLFWYLRHEMKIYLIKYKNVLGISFIWNQNTVKLIDMRSISMKSIKKLIMCRKKSSHNILFSWWSSSLVRRPCTSSLGRSLSFYNIPGIRDSETCTQLTIECK